jgi:putative heme-binding domain-containing protein
MLKLSRHLAILFLLVTVTPAFAQKDAKVPDPDPELERKSFILPPGFEVNLYAADPLLAKPLEMNFDAAGRLWVACSEVYPQIKPGQKANDKVIILEDTRGEGKADKATVFADGLLIPTGLEPGDGGVYVADSTDILHLSDTKGTGKADKRRVVLSGFGTEDTHHIIHTFRWGEDGMLYFNQSVYIHSHVETPHGVRRLNAGGIWQFRPETMELDVFVRGLWNTWGQHVNYWGQNFITDGAGGEGINYGIPGAYYAASYNPPRILPGLNPGHPKYCGLEIVSGSHLPENWRGNLITNDFRGHRVCRFIVKDDGSGYFSQQLGDLIRTNHGAFRPIDVKMGPDGAIYIADWYNPIIQHGEVDFRDPRRDHTHGRIWRVTFKDRPLVKRPQLVDARTEDLLQALKSPEGWTRHFAKRVLKERGVAKVKPALDAWIKNLDSKDAEFEHHLLEGLWMYQSIDVAEPDLLARLLKAREPRARAAAVRVVPQWQKRLADPLTLLTPMIADDFPQVRLEVVRALAYLVPTSQTAAPPREPTDKEKMTGQRAAEVALRAMDRPVDKFLDYGLWLTMRELEPYWMPAAQKGEFDFGGNPAHLVYALQAAGSSRGIQPLVALLKSGKIARDREEQALMLIANVGGPPDLVLVWERVLATEGNTPARQATLLGALEQAARQRNVKPAGDLSKVDNLLAADSDVVRAAAARSAGAWKVEAARPKLIELARAEKSTDEVRQAAFDGLLQLGGPASRTALEQLADQEKTPAVRQQAIIALASLDVEGAARRAAEFLASGPTNTDPAAFVEAFLGRKNGAKSLTKALTDKKLPPDVAKLGVRAARGAARAEPALVEAFTKAGGLTNPLRTLTPEQMKVMMADVAKQGDPARGEAIFRRKDQACLKCHAIGGAGGQVGPDLVSIGASAQVDYLIESILLPSKQIKENYHSLVVTTTDGRFLTGIKVRENKTELVLRNADDKEIVIPVKQIEEKANGGSLMPEGLADALTRGELVDLVRFLSELGKVGPYSISKARLVRRWQALEATPQSKQLLERGPFNPAAANEPALVWASIYSQVSGSLPATELPTPTTGQALVRCQLDVSTGGKVKLKLNSTAGVKLWIDQAATEAKTELEPDLTTGLHTLTFLVDPAKLREGLRVEIDDVAGSPARVQVVGGK